MKTLMMECRKSFSYCLTDKIISSAKSLKIMKMNGRSIVGLPGSNHCMLEKDLKAMVVNKKTQKRE